MANTTYSFTIATIDGTKTIEYYVPTNIRETEQFLTQFCNEFEYLYIKAIVARDTNKVASLNKALESDDLDNEKRAKYNKDIIALESTIATNAAIVAGYLESGKVTTNDDNIPVLTKVWVVLSGHFTITDYIDVAHINNITRWFFVCSNSDTTKADKDAATKAINNTLKEVFNTKEGYFLPKKVTVNDTILNEVFKVYEGEKYKLKCSTKGFSKASEKALLKVVYTQVLYQVAKERLEFPETAATNKPAKKVGFTL